MIAARRDYLFFGCLGVRGAGPEGIKKLYPRNLPEDMSELTREQFWLCPTDYHSASFATPQEFCQLWIASNTKFQQMDVRPECVEYDLLGIDITESKYEYRVVFWFDN